MPPPKPPLGSAKRSSIVGKKESTDPEKTGSTKILIWPEWTETEIGAEKWDPGGGKGKEKGKTSSAPPSNWFEDPDGQPLLPPSLLPSLSEWRRPIEYLHELHVEKAPTIVGKADEENIDLVSSNEHLLSSQFVCTLISEVEMLHHKRNDLLSPSGDTELTHQAWQPWQHIQPWPKGAPYPIYNQYGKYCVKLHWMGCWRKVTVDDTVPVNKEGQALLPCTDNAEELWPLILSKAILKVINLEYLKGREVGDISIIQLLTGWIHETIDIKSVDSTWERLASSLPRWKRPIVPADEADDSEETAEKLSEVTSVSNQPTTQEDSDPVNAILLVSFMPPLCAISHASQPICPAESRELLEGCGFLITSPAYPILLSKWRDEPLELPPKEPPLPKLQAPFYLGLTNRQPRPGSTPPSPRPTDHRFIEVYSSFLTPGSSSFPSTWLNLIDFMKAFCSISLYTRPDIYLSQSFSDLSLTTPNSVAPPIGSSKKGLSPAAVSHASNTNKGSVPSILFIDSAEPVKLKISFSSLSCWRDGSKIIGVVDTPSIGLLKSVPVFDSVQHEPSDADSSKGEEHGEEQGEERGEEEKSKEIVLGSLRLTKYSWFEPMGGASSLASVSTAGCKTVSVSLPPGRNVLKLHITSPLGHHVTVYSHSSCTLTDEDGVLPLLSKPSVLFQKHGEVIIQSIINLSKFANDPEKLSQLIKDLVHAHIVSNITKAQCSAVKVAVTQTLDKMNALVDLNTTEFLIWKKFVNQCLLDMVDLMREGKDEEPAPRLDVVSKMKFDKDGHVIPTEPEKEMPKDSSPSPTLLRRTSFMKSRNMDMDDSQSMVKEEEEETEEAKQEKRRKEVELLQESASLYQPHIEVLGSVVLQCLLALRPDMKHYPFGADRHSIAHHRTFSGTFPTLAPHKWIVIIRDVMYVHTCQKLLLRLTTPVKSCLIRIVDNDSGEEFMRSVFSPCYIEPNEKGYTLFGEIWSYSDPVEGGEWQLVLISSSPNLPMSTPTLHVTPSISSTSSSSSTTTLKTNELKLSTELSVNETKNYYLPDRDFVILRYCIKLTGSIASQVSIQVRTSKPDVQFKVEVKENNKVLACQEGCGHCVIPLVNLVSNNSEENSKQKYVVQATVLYDSWGVSDSAWPYISDIRNMEKEATEKSSSKKTKSRERGSKTPKVSTTHASAPSSATPIPDTIDTSKPHWILRIVTTTEQAQLVQVEKDTQREDELAAMIQSWEAQQPGRQKKGQLSRQKFLDAYAINREETPMDEVETKSTGGGSEAGTLTSSSTLGSSSIPLFSPVALKPLDITPFTICSDDPPVQLTESIEAERLAKKQELIQKYRAWRKDVREKREEERIKRGEMKQQQIDLAEYRQAQLFDLRNRLNAPREAIREKFLATERAKQEALARERAQEEAAANASAGGRDSKKGKPKGKKK